MRGVVVLAAALAVLTAGADARFAALRRPTLAVGRSQPAQEFSQIESTGVSSALKLRGGADDEEGKKKGLSGALAQITPTTRMYLLGCLAMAALTLLGIPEVSAALHTHVALKLVATETQAVRARAS